MNRCERSLLTAWIGCVVVFAVGTARADFVLVENFEALALDSIGGQGGWTAPHETSVVDLDPDGTLNQVLSVNTDSTILFREAVIPNGSERMMFLRFRFGGQQNYSFGLSDSSFPTQFDDFDAELSMSNATNALRINDGGTYEVLTALEADTWYNCWMLINNTSEDTRVYLHARGDDSATEADLLDAEGQTVFEFRNPAANDLVNFFIKTGGGSGPSGPLYIDDIYIENTDALNLSNPAATCPADLNHDGWIDPADLAALLGSWGPCPGCTADLSGDDLVDAMDLAALLGQWGPCE